MEIKEVINETIDWYGTIAIVGAFAIVSFKILAPTSLSYQILNCKEALGIVRTFGLLKIT